MTPNHQKQCECKTPRMVGINTCECGGSLPPQVEKVSGEKLYSLRGGMPEEWKKLKIEDALPLVEKQIGGALRRLQVQEEKPHYKACERCQEDGSGDFSCFFRHATKEQKEGLITFAAKEGWKEQEKAISAVKDAEGEETIWPDRPTPENDSWQPFIYPLHDLLMAFQKNEDNDDGSKVWETKKNEFYDLIASHKDTWELEAEGKAYDAGYERGRKDMDWNWILALGNYWPISGTDVDDLPKLAEEMNKGLMEAGREEERTKLREVVESLNEQNQITQAILGALEYRGFSDLGKYLDGDLWERIKPIILTALSEGEGR